MRCSPEILLLGDDPGTSEAAERYAARHIPQIECTDRGTPLVSSAFQAAEEFARHETVVYVNADVVLFDDLFREVERLRSPLGSKPFLFVGRRTNLDVDWEFPSVKEWRELVQQQVIERGNLHRGPGVDFFAFSKGAFPHVPPFALGRQFWDMWVVLDALRRNIATVDLTNLVLAVHQNHDYRHLPQEVFQQQPGRVASWSLSGKGKESTVNRRLMKRSGLRRRDYRSTIRVEFPSERPEPSRDVTSLLPFVNVSRDAVAGIWKNEGDSLLAEPLPPRLAQLQIPYRVPPAFALKIEAEPLQRGAGLGIGLSAHGGCAVHVDWRGRPGCWVQRSPGDRDRVVELPEPILAVGRRQHLTVEFWKSGIIVRRGQEELLRCHGSYKHESRLPPHADSVFLVVQSRQFRFHQLALQPISGKGWGLAFADEKREAKLFAAQRLLWAGAQLSIVTQAGEVGNVSNLFEMDSNAAVRAVRFTKKNRWLVDDVVVGFLRDLDSVEDLRLAGTSISDDSLKVLAALPNLRRVDVRFTRISRRGARWLRGRRSSLQVVSGWPLREAIEWVRWYQNRAA
jgi:hypothetical protein